MSVESEILRIQRNVADTYAMVAEKGGTVPLQPNSENLPAAVSSIPAGGSSSGGNPVGTVISFLGLTAPAGYLVCDGAEYEITAYPDLADHFRQQFGAANHFGGNGTDTFCVPDMRNLFLRGYHGSAEEQLSGEVGKQQEATEIPNFISSRSRMGILEVVKRDSNSFNHVKHQDKKINICDTAFYAESLPSYNFNSSDKPLAGFEYYNTRPVNMAVLYCVKAT